MGRRPRLKTIRARLGDPTQFEAAANHPCADLTPQQREEQFLNIAGEIWGRTCREKAEAREEM